jgi:hypothetical protein
MWKFLFLAQWHRGKRAFVILSPWPSCCTRSQTSIERNGAGAHLRERRVRLIAIINTSSHIGKRYATSEGTPNATTQRMADDPGADAKRKRQRISVSDSSAADPPRSSIKDRGANGVMVRV